MDNQCPQQMHKGQQAKNLQINRTLSTTVATTACTVAIFSFVTRREGAHEGAK